MRFNQVLASIIVLNLIGLLAYLQALSWMHPLGLGLIITSVVLLKLANTAV